VPITRHLARWYGWAASVPADPQRGLRAPSDRPRIGVFVKTPALPVIELLALAGLDFVCLDAEHSAFGRRELDDALGMAGALRLPALVRVAAAMAPAILQALDGGAAGLLVPHVDGRARAEEIARWSRPGSGGRGWSGSTRAAGYSTQPFAAALAAARHDPFVVAQIEDFDGLADVEAIAAVPGIDALFFGAADLAVGMGVAPGGPEIDAAFMRVASAARQSGKPLMAFVSGAEGVARLAGRGAALIVAGSDQGLLLAGARALHATAAGLLLQQEIK